ncbi:MAG: hypothetical protein AAGC86_12825 [Pseudomonadota bacterium]
MRSSILTLATLTSLSVFPVWAEPDNWDLLAGIEITETEEAGQWQVEKTIPPALSASADAFTISGYAVPIEAQAYIGSFLLVPDPDNCPFCGNSGYGPSLEVTLKRPLLALAEGTAVSVTGRLEFDLSPETYQTVRLRDALLMDHAAQP